MDKLLLFLAFFCASFTTHAQDPWDTTDKVLASVALTATVIDWGQTRYIAKNPQQFHENNPILGEHPSVGKVNTYFVGAIVAGAVVAHYLPSEYRKYFLGGVSVLEIGVAAHNKHIGIKVSF